MWDDLDKDLQMPGGQCWEGGEDCAAYSEPGPALPGRGEAGWGVAVITFSQAWLAGWGWKKFSLAGTPQTPTAQSSLTWQI